MNDTITTNNGIGGNDNAQICFQDAIGRRQVQVIRGKGEEGTIEPLGSKDTLRDDVKTEQGTEGFKVAGLKKKFTEVRVEIMVEEGVFGGEDSDGVGRNELLESLQKGSFIREFGKFCKWRI